MADELATQEAAAFAEGLKIASLLLDRQRFAAFLGNQFMGRRKLYDVLGYPMTLSYVQFRSKFERQDIAGRIVEAAPSTTWRNSPLLQEDEDPDSETAFEAAWDALQTRLRIYSRLERADTLAGIGTYAVLLIGVKGSQPLGEPIERLTGPDDVIYLQAYSQRRAEIRSWVTNPGDPRFGKPESYTIDLGGDQPGMKKLSRVVHASRVLHIAEGCLENDVYGMPRLQRVFNRLEDLEKVVGGSAEMFWQGAHRGPVLTTEADTQMPEGDDAKAISDEVQQYIDGLQRFMRLQGIKADFPAGNNPDPSKIFDVCISLISAETHIPKRILLGSERGDLASSQDDANWLSHIHERQLHYAEPTVLRPLVDRLLKWGALPVPPKGYEVQWPTLFELTQLEQAREAQSAAAALKSYVGQSGDPATVVPPWEFRERFLRLDATPPDAPAGANAGAPGDDGLDDEGATS